MFTRSDLRHTCFRMKGGNPPSEKNKHLVPIIEGLLSEHQKWENFTSVWDILVTKSNKIVIISPELDLNYIQFVCTQASIFATRNIEFEFDDRGYNVISIVESNMMENMKWQDYNKTWTISFDHELKRIGTKMFSTVQNVVTDEMIEASKKSDGSVYTPAELTNTVLEVKPAELTPFELELMNSMQKKKKLNK